MKYVNKKNGQIIEIVKTDDARGTMIISLGNGKTSVISKGTFNRDYQLYVETPAPEPEPEAVTETDTETEDKTHTMNSTEQWIRNNVSELKPLEETKIPRKELARLIRKSLPEDTTVGEVINALVEFDSKDCIGLVNKGTLVILMVKQDKWNAPIRDEGVEEDNG